MEELQHIKNLHIKEIKEIVDIPFYQFPRAIKEGQKLLKAESSEINAFCPDIHAFFTELRRDTDHTGILTSNIKKTVAQFLNTYEMREEIEFIMCSALMSKSKKIKKVLRKQHKNQRNDFNFQITQSPYFTGLNHENKMKVRIVFLHDRRTPCTRNFA